VFIIDFVFYVVWHNFNSSAVTSTGACGCESHYTTFCYTAVSRCPLGLYRGCRGWPWRAYMAFCTSSGYMCAPLVVSRSGEHVVEQRRHRECCAHTAFVTFVTAQMKQTYVYVRFIRIVRLPVRNSTDVLSEQRRPPTRHNTMFGRQSHVVMITVARSLLAPTSARCSAWRLRNVVLTTTSLLI
jgi:hypothetical protein